MHPYNVLFYLTILLSKHYIMLWYVSQSPIDGVGLFASVNVFPMDVIGVAIDSNQNVTPMASKINHSWSPNCRLSYQNNQWFLYSFRPIPQGNELTVDYRDTPDFILKPNPQWG